MTKYYLAIDWGESNCGLAVADSETRIASALEEVPTKGLIEKLKEKNEDYDFSKIILGSIEVGKMKTNQNATNEMKERLEKEGFEVEMEEESFSTKLAQQNLSETGAKGISKKDNAESARIILQGWLDSEG